MGCLQLANLEKHTSLRVLKGGKSSDHNNDLGIYWFGYNGMEKDPEMKGDGNSYTTEFRQYDPRLGRWLSLDPLMQQFPEMSPYVAFDNNPIVYTDPYGLKAANPGTDPGGEGEPDMGPELMMYDGRKGGKLTEYEKALAQGADDLDVEFGRDRNKDDYNEEIFSQNTDGNLELIKKEGNTPSKGIQDIIDDSGNYRFDCAEYVNLNHVYADYKTLGQEKFDEKYKDGLIIGNTTLSTTGIEVSEFYNRDNNTEDWYNSKNSPTGLKTQQIIGKAEIGTRIAFTSTALPTSHAYRNENTMVTGFDISGNPLLTAHPLGSDLKMSSVTESLIQIIKAYNIENKITMTDEEVRNSIFISQIEIIKTR